MSLPRTLFGLLTLLSGSDFNDADTLTTSEAKILIDAVLKNRRKDAGDDIPMTEYATL